MAITISKRTYLMLKKILEEEGMTMVKASNEFDVSFVQTYKIIKALEEEKYIKKDRKGRKVKITLLKKGKDMMQKLSYYDRCDNIERMVF